MPERYRNWLEWAQGKWQQVGARAGLLGIAIVMSFLLKFSHELSYESAAIIVALVFYAGMWSISGGRSRDLAIAAILVGGSAVMLLPMLYGPGTGIAATKGLERLFLTVVAIAVFIYGAFVHAGYDD